MTNDYRWRRRIAGVSGAALGYIGGNLAGAVTGYKLGRSLEKVSRKYWMPKRKYSGTVGPQRKRNKTGEGHVYGSVFHKYGSAGPGPRRAYKSYNRGNDAARVGRKRVSKGVNKRKKKVKVSNALREKVKKVLDDEDVEWSGTHVMYCPPLLAGQTVDNKKEFFNFPHLVDNDGATADIYRQGELFTPNTVLDAASKLFNGKTVQGATSDEMNFFDTNNFNAKTVSIKTVYQAAKFWIRNNTSRTYRICMYVLTCKEQQTSNDVKSNFVSAFHEETTNYTDATWDELFQGFSSTATFNGGYVTTQYKNEPRMYANIRKRWDVKTIDMVLEPGQVETQYVRGPAQEYDMKKYLDDGTYYTTGKGGMFTAFSVMADPVQAAPTGTPPLWNRMVYSKERAETTGAITPQLIFECERMTKVKMPEQAGMDDAADLELKNRKKDCYAYEEFFPSVAGATQWRRKDAVVTEENIN